MISIIHSINVKCIDNVKCFKNILAFYYALIYNRLNNKENKQNKLKSKQLILLMEVNYE